MRITRTAMMAAGLSVATIGSAAFGTEDLAGLHERIAPQAIASSPESPVADVLIICTQSKPMVLKRAFLVVENEARIYSSASPTGRDYCEAERGYCAAGWYDGDLVFQRDMRSGGLSTTRIDLESQTLALTYVFESGSVVKATMPCELRPVASSSQ